MVLGIDPGPVLCSWCRLDDGYRIVSCEESGVEDLLLRIRATPPRAVVMERVRGYGMRVGKETFETCRVEGRVFQVCKDLGIPLYDYCRKTYGQTLVGERIVNDSLLRKALLERFGPETMEGLKGSSGKRSAFAVAVYHLDKSAPFIKSTKAAG